MPEISPRLRQVLAAHQVGYETIHHRSDYTARETAEPPFGFLYELPVRPRISDLTAPL